MIGNGETTILKTAICADREIAPQIKEMLEGRVPAHVCLHPSLGYRFRAESGELMLDGVPVIFDSNMHPNTADIMFAPSDYVGYKLVGNVPADYLDHCDATYAKFCDSRDRLMGEPDGRAT